MFYICCETTNDVLNLLKESSIEYIHYDDFDALLQDAPDGVGVLCLASKYPVSCVDLTVQSLELINAKDLRVYLEYPGNVYDSNWGKPEQINKRRVVINQSFSIDSMDNEILTMHNNWFLPIQHPDTLLSLAAVAGYREAVYGLPEDHFSLLFKYSDNILIATSKLSQFLTGRYFPVNSWLAIWNGILDYLDETTQCQLKLPENLPVMTCYQQADQLPDNVELDAQSKSINWFRTHMYFQLENKCSVFEGYKSQIDYGGNQQIRNWNRADCLAESAMTFAFDWKLSGNPDSRNKACAMINYLWTGDLYQSDKNLWTYGLVNWFEESRVFYGDDNARVLIGATATALILNEDKWFEKIATCLLANLRTSGANGFRLNSLRWSEDNAGLSWHYFRDSAAITYAPHYQSYLWAVYIWFYRLTKDNDLLNTAKNGIRLMMEQYPSWNWTNGFSQELARMVLPLAWLLRVENTPQHREWFDLIIAHLSEYHVNCGAIREYIGDVALGTYPPPQSNEAFGKHEASLIQNEGEPVCDLLYTANFAFLGLHEAYYTTGCSEIKKRVDKLAEFLCRIQIKSLSHSYLNGAWMRGFDYELWEYGGSSADIGWSAWCVESGWTNALISLVLAMRQCDACLFDDINLFENNIQHYYDIKKEMIN